MLKAVIKYTRPAGNSGPQRVVEIGPCQEESLLVALVNTWMASPLSASRNYSVVSIEFQGVQNYVAAEEGGFQ